MENENIQKALRLIDSAEKSLAQAKKLFMETGVRVASPFHEEEAPKQKGESTAYEENGTQIIEGYFTGDAMEGPNGRRFPVPPNYASKSKLVQGDRMKLSILPNGTMLYKQISPTPRKLVKGYLIREENNHYVQTVAKNYRVLLASVTYFRVELGDQVSLWVPEQDEEAEWGAIEALIPSLSSFPTTPQDDFESMSF